MFTGAIPQDIPQTDKTFRSLGLDVPVLQALERIGFERPTPIQADVIPLGLQGKDVIGLAQTGSGKTAAFALPMIDYLLEGSGVGGLILCPTRELALQCEAFLRELCKTLPVKLACLIGGAAYGPQIRDLKAIPDIVVATPGRLIDHMERRNVDLSTVEILVLDEADHMLDLGFLPQITRVLEEVPRDRQTFMFSATMPGPIERLANRFMQDPVRIDILPEGRAAEGIDHRLYLVKYDDKKPCLLSLASQEKGSMLVFVRRKVDADWASRQLEIEGHPVERIHSDRSQSQRVRALQGLRQGEHRILVATDIAARGIDVPIIEHIVNFNVPAQVEDYIHRAGRTARGSRGGVVSTIATWKDKAMIREIEKALGQKLPRCEAPGVPAYEERNQRKTIKGRERIQRRLL